MRDIAFGEVVDPTSVEVGPVRADDPHFRMQHRLAGRAGLARGVLAVECQHRRRRLGHAIALLQGDAALFPHFQERHRHRRAADAADHEAAEIGRRE